MEHPFLERAALLFLGVARVLTEHRADTPLVVFLWMGVLRAGGLDSDPPDLDRDLLGKKACPGGAADVCTHERDARVRAFAVQ